MTVPLIAIHVQANRLLGHQSCDGLDTPIDCRADEEHVVPVFRRHLGRNSRCVQIRKILVSCDVDGAGDMREVDVDFMWSDHEVDVILWNTCNEPAPKRNFARAVTKWVVGLVTHEDGLRNDPSSPPQGFWLK